MDPLKISNENSRAKVGFIKICNKSYPIYEGLNIIGRDPKATVRVSNLTFSKQHAILSVVNSTTHLISDFGSSNGTVVRKIKLHPFKFYNIKDLESITFGDVVGVYRVCDVDSQTQNEANNSEIVDYIAPTQPLTLNIHDVPTQPFVTVDSNQSKKLYNNTTQMIHEADTQIIESNHSKSVENIHDKETQLVVEDKKQSDALDKVNLLKISSQDEIDLSRTELYDDVFANESFRLSFQNNGTKYDIEVDETLPTDSKIDKSITNNDNNDCIEDDDIILSTQDNAMIEKQSLDLIKKSHKIDNETNYQKIENNARNSSETKLNEISKESKHSKALFSDNKDDDSETDIEDEELFVKITTKSVEKTKQNDSDSETDAEDDLLAKNIIQEPTHSDSDTEVEDNLLANLPTCENNESSKTNDINNKSNKVVFSDEEEELDLLAPNQNLQDAELQSTSLSTNKINESLQSKIDKQIEINDDDDLLLVPTQLLEIKKEVIDDEIDMLAPTQLLENKKEANDDDIDMLAPTQLLGNNKVSVDDENDKDLLLVPTQLLQIEKKANDDEIDMLAPTQLLENKKEANDDDNDMLAPTQLLENKKANDDDIDMLAPTQLLGNKKITVDDENDDDLLAPTQLLQTQQLGIKEKQVEHEAVALCRAGNALRRVDDDDDDLPPTQLLENSRSKNNKTTDDDPYLAPTQILETNKPNYSSIFSAPTQILEKNDANIFSPPKKPSILSTKSPRNKEKRSVNFSEELIYDMPTQKLHESAGNIEEIAGNNKEITGKQNDIFTAPTQPLAGNNDLYKSKTSIKGPDESTSSTTLNNSQESLENLSLNLVLSETDEESICENVEKLPSNKSTDNSKASVSSNITKCIPEPETQLEVEFSLETQKIYVEEKTARPDNPLAHMFGEEPTQMTEEITELKQIDNIVSKNNQLKEIETSRRLLVKIQNLNVVTEISKGQIKSSTSVDDDFKSETKRKKNTKTTSTNENIKPHNTRGKRISYQKLNSGQSDSKTLTKRGKLSKSSESDTSEKEELTNAKKSAEMSQNQVNKKMSKKEAIKEDGKRPSKNSESDKSEKEEVTEVIQLAKTSERLLSRDKLKTSKKESVNDDEKHEKRPGKNLESDKSVKDISNVVKSAEMSEKRVIRDSKTSKKETTKEDEKEGSLTDFDDFINRRTRSKGPQNVAITPKKKAEKKPNLQLNDSDEDTPNMSTYKTKKEINKIDEKNEKPPKTSKIDKSEKEAESPKKRASRVNKAPKKETVKEDENDENLSDFDDFINRRTRSKRTHSVATPKSKTKKEKNLQPEDSDEDTDTMPTHIKKKIVKLQYTDDSEIGASNSSSHSTVVRNTKRSMKIEDYSSDENAKSNTSATSICLNTPNTKRRKYEPLNVTVNQTSNITGESIKHKIVFTMLNDPELENSVTKLGGSVIDSVHLCTVLVTSKITRSLKFLVALALGKPIVDTKWISDSVKKNSFQDPWNYLLEDKESEEKFKFVLKDSLQRSIEKKLLSNVVVLIAAKKNYDVLKEVIETSGGKCIQRTPAKNGKAIVVCYEEEKSQYKKYLKQKSLTIVSAEAIFSGVLQQELNWNLHLLS